MLSCNQLRDSFRPTDDSVNIPTQAKIGLEWAIRAASTRSANDIHLKSPET